MKCILCTQRKAKRFCPAKNSMICPQCCGEKRVLEIACPEGCDYLKAGRLQEMKQAGELFFRAADPREEAKRARIVDELEPLLSELQTVIAVERLASKDLRDDDLAEALDCLLKTLRTEDNGIIYETTSSKLRAESLRRQLSEVLQKFRYPKEADKPRLLLRQGIDCLEVLRAVVGNYLESGGAPLRFVDFLARQLRRSPEAEPAKSSIIIPGR